MPRRSPLSSAIRKEHPFGCSFLIHEVSGFGSGLRDRLRSLEIGVTNGKIPFCVGKRRFPYPLFSRSAFGVEGLVVSHTKLRHNPKLSCRHKICERIKYENWILGCRRSI